VRAHYHASVELTDTAALKLEDRKRRRGYS
jgi:predicted DNA-binding WGR domain protein